MKKLIAALLLTALVGSLVGCAQQPQTTGSTPSTASTASTGESTKNTDPLGRYEEPVTITFVKQVNSTDNDQMNALGTAYGETWEDNRWTRLYKDKLNIDVKYQWIVDSSQYAQKWKLAMSSGSLPDVMTVNQTDLAQLVDAGLVQEMGPVWDEYASELSKKYVDMVGKEWLDGISFDGKVMGVPGYAAPYDYCRYLWIRTDWLNNLGLQAPKTLEDLFEVWRAFATRDPDGNGENDTYSYMIQNTLWFELEGLFWSFRAYPDAWLEKQDGTLEFGATRSEMKDALRFLQDAYSEGWIDPEFVTTGFLDYKQVTNGKIGMTGGTEALAAFLKQSYQLDPKADWGIYEWPSADGSTVDMQLELEFSYTMAVNSEYKHPEALVKMRNLYMDVLYGENADLETYMADAKTGNQYIGMYGPFIASGDPLSNLNAYYDAVAVLDGSKKYEDLKGVSKTYWDNVNNENTAWEYSRYWYPSGYSAGDMLPKYIDNDAILYNKFVGAPTETMVDRWSTLNDLLNTTVTKIIVGDLDVDAGFDAFVQDWYNMGGKAITEEVNEWYRSVNP